MSIGTLLKGLGLLLWLIAFAWSRLGEPYNKYDLVAAGAFFWFLPELVHLP